VSETNGNNAAMREALQQASYFLHRHHTGAVYASDGETLIFCEDVAKIVDAALAAPPRNCDVVPLEAPEAADVFHRERPYHGYCYETHDWLLAPATKGSAE